MKDTIKLQDFFQEVCPSFKASFITTIKSEYGAEMDKIYDKQMLIDILNELQMTKYVKGAF